VSTRVYDLLRSLLDEEDDQIRSSAAGILGSISQYVDDGQLNDLLKELSDSASSSNWCARHGSAVTLSSMLRHNASRVCVSSVFPSVLSALKTNVKDEKFPVREGAVKALGRYLLYEVKSNPSNSTVHSQLLISVVPAFQDDSSEVRRRALSTLKAAAKANPSAIMAQASVFGPALAECVKDGSTPVRVAAERCALHVFQLTKGADNVQMSQKYITGLDARRLAKYPENSDDDEDSEDERGST
jgi:HEAT repeat protein